MFTFFAPVIVVGFSQNIQFHMEWLELIRSNMFEQSGLLDVASVLSRCGWINLGRTLRFFILLGTIIYLFYPVVTKKQIIWNRWIPMGLSCLLLVSPRTESPTFVFVGPCYIFLTELFLKEKKVQYIVGFVLIVSIFLISISYNDIWPKWVWDPGVYHYATKVLGVFLIWITASTIPLMKGGISWKRFFDWKH